MVLYMVKCVLETEVDQGHLRTNIAKLIDSPVRKRSKKIPGEWTLTTSEIKQLLIYLEANPRHSLLCTLAILQGLRRGEISGLKWDKVDLEQGIIIVDNNRVVTGGGIVDTDTKTISGTRILPLQSQTRKALDAALVLREWNCVHRPSYISSEYVVVNGFGQPYRPEGLGRIWNQTLKSAGLEKHTLHHGRHTLASILVNSGDIPLTEVQKLLGHSDLTTTLRYTYDQTETWERTTNTLSKLRGEES